MDLFLALSSSHCLTSSNIQNHWALCYRIGNTKFSSPDLLCIAKDVQEMTKDNCRILIEFCCNGTT